MTITILGAGAFGKALGHLLKKNHHQVKYYDPELFPDLTLSAATASAEAIVIAIPSASLSTFLATYPETLKSLPTILATKGLLDLTLFEDFAKLDLISGPMLAKEIIDNQLSAFTASSDFAANLFSSSLVRIDRSDDKLGILLCGSLKNIYAIGAGYYAENHNNQAIFIADAHHELASYLYHHGALPATSESYCGLADLILTCTSQNSRNFRCGSLLREGHSLPAVLGQLTTVEGLSALESLDATDYPLLSAIKTIVDARSHA
ncbi:hypothetical protein IKF15_02755 [Candidatus Saccharibacteria bacterium]|nr:hypothetical protein [Candidatus Saccharibacteria bacterium]